MPDGTHKAVTRRTGPSGERWTTERDARRALRAVLVAALTCGDVVSEGRLEPFAYITAAGTDPWLSV